MQLRKLSMLFMVVVAGALTVQAFTSGALQDAKSGLAGPLRYPEDYPSPTSSKCTYPPDIPSTSKAFSQDYTVRKLLICPPVTELESRTVYSQGIGACGWALPPEKNPVCQPHYNQGFPTIQNNRHYWTQKVDNKGFHTIMETGYCFATTSTHTVVDFGPTIDGSACGSGEPGSCDGLDPNSPEGCDCLGGEWYPGIEGPPWCDTFETPLLLDLESRSVQFKLTSVECGVVFDIRATGSPVKVAWTSPGSSVGFIVRDRNGDGRIDDGSELFGNRTVKRDGTLARHAFDALADLDDNGDGRIDADDSVYPELMLWIDANHNGVSEPWELRTLADAGVVSLFTDWKETSRRDRHGNLYRYVGRASIIGKNGAEEQRVMVDVLLRTSAWVEGSMPVRSPTRYHAPD